MSSIDRYLKKIAEPQKSTLKSVRELLAELLPGSIECISYGLPAFRFKGAVIGGFAAREKHCSYYPFSGSTLKTLKKQLAKYEQTKSALHFPLNKPLSKSVVKLLVKTRLAEVEMKLSDGKSHARSIK